ncbi:hypothetical protein [Mycobacterium intracellulare]|uniref:hypothetical protein n=1 Tax=Mycobacterium intracellulare TaxID=1767 RepID=UPI0011558680|nr:hypothetical protein [Mycobacterium intracellulare]MCA2231591.1 hypothetical protein [Mycobacterium intracellulare]
MSLEDDVLAELKKHPEHAAISGEYLASQLSRSVAEILAAARSLENSTRQPGSDYLVITTNKRDDHRIEPPEEFYLHLSSVEQPSPHESQST